MSVNLIFSESATIEGINNILIFSKFCSADLIHIESMQFSYNDTMIKYGIPKCMNPIFYFNRIKVFNRSDEGKEYGKEIMIKLCKFCDEKRYGIFCELNPYGKRDLKSLTNFYKASNFIGTNYEKLMFRYPQSI